MPDNLLTAPVADRAPPAAPPPLPPPPAGAGTAAAAAAAAAGGGTGNGRPPHVPQKFWDPDARQIRVDALLKSYLELERKLSAMVPMPGPDMGAEDQRRLLAALGVPGRPEDYAIDCPHGLFAPDPELNARLHGAGFTPAQAQLVYDLAAERMVPLLQEIAADFEAEREIERLVEYFGGEDRWREVSRQMLAWARKTLPPAAVEGLSSSFDGVMALYRMMSSAEPAPLRPGSGGEAPGDESELHGMIRDPRYWRDKDPAFIAKVTEGFRRLFPGGA